jgi:hypothetical protein
MVFHFQTGAARFVVSPPTPNSDISLCCLCQGFVCMSIRQPGVTLASHCVVATMTYYCAVCVRDLSVCLYGSWHDTSVTLCSGSLKIRRFRTTRLNTRCVLCGNWGFTGILFRSCGKSFRMAFAGLCLISKWGKKTSHIYLQPSTCYLLTPMHADGTFNFDTVKIFIQFLEMNGKSAFLAHFPYLKK